ncbi:hypothetical protein [Alloprevotella tannerae]|uniref:hypothetical protein n=1 Tax=Alloprevotella tannerae TaxID=76122 RepID=UPI0028ECC409|nr:hypothetical protein [Alloprevotella tannerae]
MVISKIEVNNIKGIENLAINEYIYPNRPNILVAPNGFGKSSLAVAFKTLLANKIELKPEEEPIPKNGDPSVVLSLSTGQTISANKNSNTIRESFSIHVVTNPLLPTAKAQKYGKIVTAKASMNIEPTVVIKTIPKVVHFDYNLTNMKSAFGASNKILMDISKLYSNYTFLDKIEKKINTHIFELNPYKKAISSTLAAINHLHTNTAREIKKHIVAGSMFASLCSEFHTISAFIKKELALEDVDAYLCAWQFITIKLRMRGNYKRALQYAEYVAKKTNLDDTLKEINPFSGRFNIVSKKKNRSLIIEWPKAHLISSGQRDIMVFIAKLMECEYQAERNCILVIDEFFDYLDDANVVAFQYYISTLINSFKKSKRIIFPILLTHLDPNYLKHFCFNDSRLNVVYLKQINAQVSDKMAKLVANRENTLIKDVLDSHYFHFSNNGNDVDVSAEFERLGLNKDWGHPAAFVKKINRELRTYLLQPGDKYDPLAVCFAVRRRVEELVYLKLQEEHRISFLSTHGTNEKLHEAQNHGISIPETYFLLGIVYNHPLHIAGDEDLSKPLGMKLDNPSIKNMINKLWKL